MIRVNLLQNRTSSGGEALDAPPNADVLAAKNMGIMLSLIALMYGYESLNISSLKDDTKVFTRKARTLSVKLKEQEALASEAKELSKELNQVKDRVKIIRQLSKGRLTELKSR